ncbi:hypothetical protein E2562_029675 [Oryza meyeriana var. granulata]|uniref:Uncharacterized protein n=1 Tax=Oryza meyeriana var. granulata TaxID=110450 RepID=A0A6G1C1A0_9ORYZ|nr:hypothetical protein E2562_029675 [Oryza meyeriana var. granulata]
MSLLLLSCSYSQRGPNTRRLLRRIRHLRDIAEFGTGLRRETEVTRGLPSSAHGLADNNLSRSILTAATLSGQVPDAMQRRPLRARTATAALLILAARARANATFFVCAVRGAVQPGGAFLSHLVLADIGDAGVASLVPQGALSLWSRVLLL